MLKFVFTHAAPVRTVVSALVKGALSFQLLHYNYQKLH